MRGVGYGKRQKYPPALRKWKPRSVLPMSCWEEYMDIKKHFASFYQFNKEQETPIFIGFESKEIDRDFQKALLESNFTACEPNSDWNALLKGKDYRILKMVAATPKVYGQIRKITMEMGSWGKEIVKQNYYYDMYAFAHRALMIQSMASRVWEMAVSTFNPENFAHSDKLILLNRYLSLAGLKLGIIGFWGVRADDYLVVTTQEKSSGEAFYIDVNAMQIINKEGIKPLYLGQQIVKLQESLLGTTDNSKMSGEDLFAHLVSKSSVYRYNVLVDGLLRKSCDTIVKYAQGRIFLERSFSAGPDNLAA